MQLQGSLSLSPINLFPSKIGCYHLNEHISVCPFHLGFLTDVLLFFLFLGGHIVPERFCFRSYYQDH